VVISPLSAAVEVDILGMKKNQLFKIVWIILVSMIALSTVGFLILPFLG